MSGNDGFDVLAESVPRTSGSIVGVMSMAFFIDRSISDRFSLLEIKFSEVESAKIIDGLAVGMGLIAAVGLVVGADVGA